MTAPSAALALDTATLQQPDSRPPRDRVSQLSGAIDALTQLLNAPLDLRAASTLASLRAASLSVAKSLDQSDHLPARGPLTEALLTAAGALATHPLAALPADEATLDATRAITGAGWAGSLARMFAAPAWQTPNLRPLADQTPWLWAAYARYLFTAPAFFQTTTQEHQWAAHLLTHLEPLVRMLDSNRGSSTLRTVAGIVSAAAAQWPAVGTDDQLRRRQQSLGRLLTLLAPRLAPFRPASATYLGMALRVGILCEQSSTGAVVFEANRLKTLLERERFEVSTYALNELPFDTAAQVDTLRAARLDVAIFAGDLTRTDAPLTALAVYRVAGRQFATALSPHTTGLPEIDVFLTDATASPSAYTERLATLPAALAFDTAAQESALTRLDFDLPADARLIVTTVNPAHFPAETRARWQALLNEDASARVLVLPDGSGPVLDLLFADLERQFGDRVILAGNTPLELPAVDALLRVSDVYLQSGAPGSHLHHDLAQHLGLAVPDAPACIDCLGFADALAEVIETACFRPKDSLVATAPACDAASRRQHASNLITIGRPDRATLYLLAAVEDPDAGPEVWHDLALALHANQQGPEAIQALETCVRLAPERLDSWLLLADWARDYGHNELVKDITSVVQELAPNDERVLALAIQFTV